MISRELLSVDIRKSKIDNELREAENQIAAIPSEEDIKQSAAVNRNIYKMLLQSGKHLRKMTLDDRTKLFQAVFDGLDRKGNRLGVYVRKDSKHAKRVWFYEVKGQMINEFGRLPMPVDEMQLRLGIHECCDPEYDPLKHDSYWSFDDDKLPTESNCFVIPNPLLKSILQNIYYYFSLEYIINFTCYR